ncbi:hypothetical protein Goshw_016487 [Gossypium schwendimanii]|uniref:Uncharacterized protein n=1 Tax=Gossypium schwendimanii TaxID=34291 RepID=A0A7J9LFY7_GOSSC|nr:hypothetical protein [Gossypium schwendimanii]
MAWLRRTFAALDKDSTEVERERHTRTYILRLSRGSSCWRHCSERCVGRRNWEKSKLMVAFYYCNHRHAREGLISSVHYCRDARD